MNVLDKHIMYKLNNIIIDGYYKSKNIIEYKNYKQKINNDYNIYYFNVIKTKEKNKYNIMIKRRNYTYIYSFNSSDNKILLIGERKNVNT